MEIDISRVPYKWWPLTCAASERNKAMCLLRRAAGAWPPIISHAFLKDSTAKTFSCKTGFSSRKGPVFHCHTPGYVQ